VSECVGTRKSTESARRLPQACDVVVKVCDVAPKLVALRECEPLIAAFPARAPVDDRTAHSSLSGADHDCGLCLRHSRSARREVRGDGHTIQPHSAIVGKHRPVRLRPPWDPAFYAN
jgi:hypothetical protein